jgi:hypothetical protein
LWYVARKLYGKTCKEFASMANISTTSREKEASPETLLIKVSAGDSPRNCRLSCAGQAI